jgi:RimJ/RimL family protein N-acetyltransferase
VNSALKTKSVGEDGCCFVRTMPIGLVALRPVRMPADAALIHDWVGRDYARFWNMGDKSLAEIEDFYAALVASGHAMAYLGLVENDPAFLVERYDPAHDQIAEHYAVQPGDRGMHILVGPARRPIAGFTLAVMRTVMDFMFAYPSVRRVVVEPDIRNDKIHILNKRVGFRYHRPIVLREKTAHLAFCTREDYVAATVEAVR